MRESRSKIIINYVRKQLVRSADTKHMLIGNRNNKNGGRGSTDELDQVRVQVPLQQPAVSGQCATTRERQKSTEALEDPDEVEKLSNQLSNQSSEKLSGKHE